MKVTGPKTVGIISPIYLGDAVIELILIGWWLLDIFI
jgi:hypothetical protein